MRRAESGLNAPGIWRIRSEVIARRNATRRSWGLTEVSSTRSPTSMGGLPRRANSHAAESTVPDLHLDKLIASIFVPINDRLEHTRLATSTRRVCSGSRERAGGGT